MGKRFISTSMRFKHRCRKRQGHLPSRVPPGFVFRRIPFRHGFRWKPEDVGLPAPAASTSPLPGTAMISAGGVSVIAEQTAHMPRSPAFGGIYKPSNGSKNWEELAPLWHLRHSNFIGNNSNGARKTDITASFTGCGWSQRTTACSRVTRRQRHQPADRQHLAQGSNA